MLLDRPRLSPGDPRMPVHVTRQHISRGSQRMVSLSPRVAVSFEQMHRLLEPSDLVGSNVQKVSACLQSDESALCLVAKHHVLHVLLSGSIASLQHLCLHGNSAFSMTGNHHK